MTIRYFLVTAACLSCLGCQATTPSNLKNSASTADDPPAADAMAPSATANTVVCAYYFHQTFRCARCEWVEEQAARAIQENFAQPVQKGQVVWRPVNIDKPEGKALQARFNGQANDLVLARMEGSVCRQSKKLDQLWTLSVRPEAMSQYLVDEISAYLSPVQRR
jgi:hypothetical protein